MKGSDEEKTAIRALLSEIQRRQIEPFAELWSIVGDICPPKLIGGMTGGVDRLSRADVHRIADEMDAWYRKHGIMLDQFSRYWLIALRETCFAWLSTHPAENDVLNWQDPIGPRLWLIKTALRISLTDSVFSPMVNLSDCGERHERWVSMKSGTADLLRRNFEVVARAWKEVVPIDSLRESDVESEIRALENEPPRKK